jgi:hypothetical protein
MRIVSTPRNRLAPTVLIPCLYWRPASSLRPSPPLQPRRLHYLRLAPPVLHPTRRRYNHPACAFLLYPPVFLPGYYLQLSLQVTPVSLASAFQLPACAFGCALWPCFQRASGLRLLPIFHADWRPASTLIACRTPTRPQCNSRLAPQATRLWLRRRFNLWLAPDVASFG